MSPYPYLVMTSGILFGNVWKMPHTQITLACPTKRKLKVIQLRDHDSIAYSLSIGEREAQQQNDNGNAKFID